MPILSNQKYKLKNSLRLRNLMFLVLMSYFLCGIILGLRQQIFVRYKFSGEIYPIFSWFLFSETPNKVQRFSVIISEYDGKKFDPPLPWHKVMELISGTRVSGARFHSAIVLVQRIGDAHINSDKNKFTELRKQFEGIFLENRPTKYQIIEESYNPLEKWKFGDSKVVKKSIWENQKGTFR